MDSELVVLGIKGKERRPFTKKERVDHLN